LLKQIDFPYHQSIKPSTQISVHRDIGRCGKNALQQQRIPMDADLHQEFFLYFFSPSHTSFKNPDKIKQLTLLTYTVPKIEKT